MYQVLRLSRLDSYGVYTRQNGPGQHDDPIPTDYGCSRGVLCVSRIQRSPSTTAAYMRESTAFVCSLSCDTFGDIPPTLLKQTISTRFVLSFYDTLLIETPIGELREPTETPRETNPSTNSSALRIILNAHDIDGRPPTVFGQHTLLLYDPIYVSRLTEMKCRPRLT